MTNKNKIEQLLARCKKQEWAAQKELYLLFLDDMMSTALRYSSDHASAKDLLQETFLIFFDKINQYDESKGSLGAWLRRVLINKSYEQYRKSNKLVFYGEDQMVDQVSHDTTAIEALEAEDVLRLLQGLPQGCRIIFNLKVIEGYNHNEIGAMLKITPSASRSQLTRAKKLLRSMIEERETLESFEKQPLR